MSKLLSKKRLRVTLVSFAWCLVVPGMSGAQDAPVPIIRGIEYVGLDRTSEVLVGNVVGVTVGDVLDRAVLDEAVADLLSSGRFLTASYRVESEVDGVRVIFELGEPSGVEAIRFEGNEKFKDKKLQGLVDQKVGSPIEWFAIRNGREAIVAEYHEAGFGDVVVDFDRDLLLETGELVYTIGEGKRVRIRKIVFEGNDSLLERELKRRVDTKTAFWFLRVGAFDEDRIESDLAKLRGYCRDQGFLDARVSYRRELSEDREDLTITFVIDEGARYTIESIEFSGHSVFSQDELRGLIESRVGETVKRPQIDADVRAVRTRYGEIGHIYATARAIRVFSETPGMVRVAIEIEEGEQFRVGEVIVRGNQRTKDKVVRRALNLYPPDDLYDLTEAKEAEQRLRETRIFSSARVYPVGDSPGVRDVVIDVKEADRVGDFLFGAGVTSNSGLVGNIVLDLRNFDLYDTPRSLGELLKFRAFFGAGQHLRIKLQPGTVVNRFQIDFTEPYFLDKPLRFDASGYLFERGREGYTEQRAGASVSFNKRFERGWMHGWSAELALRAENASVKEVDIFASREIRKDEGSNIMTSVKGSLVRDRTDSRFVPSVGDRLRLGYEQFGVFGGDHRFGKLTARYTWYNTLYTDMFERKSILQLRAEGGVIIGDAPVFHRYYAGGTSSIRGFQFRGIGPRDGLQHNNVGGDYLVLLGGEYSYPLFGEKIRGLFFVDTAAVGSGTWRASIGTGVKFSIEIFGSVPLELDLAFPISSDSRDEEQIFSFQIGSLF